MNSTTSIWIRIALLLAIVGAANWGLVGAFNFNLVTALLGSMPMLEKAVYILVGISGLLCLSLFQSNQAPK
jgi:uncharacterized membrane protein YuzA (DUF378 family)